MPRVNGYDIEERWYVLDHPRGPLHTFASEQQAIDEVAKLKETYEIGEGAEIPDFEAIKEWFVVCSTIVKAGPFLLKTSAEIKARTLKECNHGPKPEPDDPFQVEEKAKIEKKNRLTKTPPAVSKT